MANASMLSPRPPSYIDSTADVLIDDVAAEQVHVVEAVAHPALIGEGQVQRGLLMLPESAPQGDQPVSLQPAAGGPADNLAFHCGRPPIFRLEPLQDLP